MTNRRTLEERECIVRSPILVRWKAQGLNFPTHKDSYQYLAPLLQNVRLKMRYFHEFRDFHQHFIPPVKIKQNPKATSLFFNNQKYFAATMKILKKIQSHTKSSAKYNWKSKKSQVVKQKMNNCGKTCSDTKIRILFIKSLLKTQKIVILVL